MGTKSRLQISMLALLYPMLVVSMVRPAKHVSLWSSQFSEAFLVITRPLLDCLSCGSTIYVRVFSLPCIAASKLYFL